MTKPMTIKSPSKAWAAVNPNGDVWHIDCRNRTKRKFTQDWFNSNYPQGFKPHGWRVVRVTIIPATKKKGSK